MQPHIFISTGETSGDLLGANLAKSLLQKNPSLKLTGMGDCQMQKAGVSLVFDSKKLSFVGIIEIIKHLPTIFLTWHHIKNYLKKEKPDLVILIDLPDTHCHIMKIAKKLNIPVLYYVSPQIWAWRYSRIKQIKKYVDHMAVLFAFEEKIYRDAGIPVTFVGHPLGDLARPTMPKVAVYDFFKLDCNNPIVVLFPGSRNSELKNHLPTLILTVKKIQEKKHDAQFVLFLAHHFNKNDIVLSNHIRIIQHNLYDLLHIATVAIAVSGTITLEIALMKTPLCVIYKLDQLTFWIAKKLIRVKNIALCNIVSEKSIAKEFIQHQATPDAISNEIIKLLMDEKYYQNMKKELGDIRKHITIENHHASQLVAQVAITLCNSIIACK